jgi:protein-S-isoprenylcysteine O-methyltransferase Ste14
MWYVLVGPIALFGFGAIAWFRACHELTTGRVSRPTFVLMLLTFGSCGAGVIAAAWSHAWLLPLSRTAALVAGISTITSGAVLCIAARLTFTFRRTWALNVDVLVTHGVYRFVRNPQVLGWFLMYCGVGLIGRSAAAITLAGVFFIECFPWILIEEKALDRGFGEQYKNYRLTARRFV